MNGFYHEEYEEYEEYEGIIMVNSDELSNRVIGLALEVHKQLGSGLINFNTKIKKEISCTSW